MENVKWKMENVPSDSMTQPFMSLRAEREVYKALKLDSSPTKVRFGMTI